jgi:hypothetical protein
MGLWFLLRITGTRRNTLCGQNTESLVLSWAVRIVTTMLYRVKLEAFFVNLPSLNEMWGTTYRCLLPEKKTTHFVFKSL